MPFIRIKNIISFASNNGVLVDKEALKETPEELHRLIDLAWAHMDDQLLIDACQGGIGPLAKYGEITFEEYLQIKEDADQSQITGDAKKRHTKIRRAEYTSKRSQLLLAMVDSGMDYRCSKPGCKEHTHLTIDHIIPLSRGGGDELTNLQFLCIKHNSEKGDKIKI